MIGGIHRFNGYPWTKRAIAVSKQEIEGDTAQERNVTAVQITTSNLIFTTDNRFNERAVMWIGG